MKSGVRMTQHGTISCLTNMDEGDIVRGMRRTMDLLRHIKNGPHLKKELTDLAKYGLEMMDKEPVRENL